ncbi:hypothetical protein V1514DRAFT_328792 [Lipomyces japonicus]|uniref:uncharacterized protein n=1 Tax=Lipomyces japonicus TaxID=56871 RepID=UPI0034CFC2CB
MSQGLLIGQKCLVTGGSRGIGFVIAHKLAQLGASCLISSRSLPTAQAAAALLPVPMSFQSQCHAGVELDVSQPWPRSLNSSSSSTMTDVSVLVNCAGQAHSRLLVSMAEEDMQDLVGVNLLGVMYGCKAISRLMLRRKVNAGTTTTPSSSSVNIDRGVIVNVSSVLAAQAGQGAAVYAACKAGVEGLTRALACELGPRGIRVNAVRPGLVRTSMTDKHVSDDRQSLVRTRIPLGRLGTADDVADAVVFLITNRYVNGQVLTVDGGFTAA